jgi:hypothetical protein
VSGCVLSGRVIDLSQYTAFYILRLTEMKKYFLLLLMATISFGAFAQQKDVGKTHKKHQDHTYSKGHPDEEFKKRKGAEKGVKHVPAKVAESFKRDYEHARNIVWTKSKGIWMVNFSNGLYRSTATYYANGNRMYTQTRMKADQAPELVSNEIYRKFPRAGNGNKIIRYDLPNGKIQYNIRMMELGKMKSFFFTEDGKLLN